MPKAFDDMVDKIWKGIKGTKNPRQENHLQRVMLMLLPQLSGRKDMVEKHLRERV